MNKVKRPSPSAFCLSGAFSKAFVFTQFSSILHRLEQSHETKFSLVLSWSFSTVHSDTKTSPTIHACLRLGVIFLYFVTHLYLLKQFVISDGEECIMVQRHFKNTILSLS